MRNTGKQSRQQSRKNPPRQPRTSEKTLRGWASIVKLWAVCDNAACRKARACRGAIHTCAPKNFAKAPEEVRGILCCLLAAKAEGLSFDEAIEGFPGSRAEAAWHDWCAQVEERVARN